MTPDARQRLLDILAGRPSEAAAVLCPGGMMSLAVTEVMDAEGVGWPEAHTDAEAMLRLAVAMQQATAFDNLALPFCMTVEAGAYGARVDLGTRTVQPRVRGHVLTGDHPPAGRSPSAGEGPDEFPSPDFRTGRAGVLLRALSLAKARHPELPLIGNLVGPFSLLGMLADPLRVMRWTRRQPDVLLKHVERLTDDLGTFGTLQVEAGADVICIAEPTATGEILGGGLFRQFVLPSLNRLAGRLHAAGVSVIVHICGDARPIEPELLDLSADAVSFDSMVNITRLAARKPPWQVMGNVDAFLLETGPVHAILRTCQRLLKGGVRLLAPACGVTASTPVSHLKVMRNAVQPDA